LAKARDFTNGVPFAGQQYTQIEAYWNTMNLATMESLVTRNARDFEGLGVEVINPWGG
jgi:hypothetical protein